MRGHPQALPALRLFWQLGLESASGVPHPGRRPAPDAQRSARGTGASGPSPAVTADGPRSPPAPAALCSRPLTRSRPHSPSPPRWSRPARCPRSCTRGGLASWWLREGSGEGRHGGQGGVHSSGDTRRSAARVPRTLIRLTLCLRLKLNHPFPTLRPFPGPWGGRGSGGGGGAGRRLPGNSRPSANPAPRSADWQPLRGGRGRG